MEPAAVEAHGPGAGDVIAPISLTDRGEVPADRRIDRVKQSADRRIGIISQGARGLTAMPERLAQRMCCGSVDFVERMAEIAKIILQVGPTLRWIDAIGLDQPVIIVEQLVAGIAREPPRDGEQSGNMFDRRGEMHAELRCA